MVKVDSVIDQHDLYELLKDDVPVSLENHVISVARGIDEVVLSVDFPTADITHRVWLRYLYGETFRVICVSGGGAFFPFGFSDVITVDALLNAIERVSS